MLPEAAALKVENQLLNRQQASRPRHYSGGDISAVRDIVNLGALWGPQLQHWGCSISLRLDRRIPVRVVCEGWERGKVSCFMVQLQGSEDFADDATDLMLIMTMGTIIMAMGLFEHAVYIGIPIFDAS